MFKKTLAAVATVALSFALAGVAAFPAAAEESSDPVPVVEEQSTVQEAPPAEEPQLVEEPVVEEPVVEEPVVEEPVVEEPVVEELVAEEPVVEEEGELLEEELVSDLTFRTQEFTTADDENGPPIDTGEKVTLCHSPSSESNPWVVVTISVNAVEAAGHLEPSDNDTHDDDIIPPFTYQENGPDGEIVNFPGKNLDTVFGGFTGQQILDAGCDYPEIVTPSASADHQWCDEQGEVAVLVNGFITVEIIEGITYLIKDDEDNTVPYDAVTGETGLLEPGIYTVTATDTDAFDGKVLDGPFEVDVEVEEFDGLCGDLTTEPLVTPQVSTTPITCEANGSYTLSTLDDVNEEGVDWTAAGLETTEGTYPVSTAGSFDIVATPVAGYGFPGEELEITFPVSFTTPTGCDLETLALTGNDDPAPALTIAALLGLLGLAMIRGHARLRTVE